MTTVTTFDPPLPQQIRTAREFIAKGCTDEEIEMFAQVCERTGLDPFARQIYAMKSERSGKFQIQTSIDGFRLIAERSGKYRGQVGPFWCGDDGAWKDVWLAKVPPAAARIGIIHRDFAEPVWSVARFADYSAGGPMWTKMGPTMIAKCCEALGLRRCFPQLSGLYTTDEMAQADDEPAHRPVGSLARVKEAPVGPKIAKWNRETPAIVGEVQKVFPDAREVVDEKTGEVTQVRHSAVTKAQFAKIHVLKAACRFSDEDWKGRLKAKYGTDTSASLTRAQASDLIERLQKMVNRLDDVVEEIAPHLADPADDTRGYERTPEEMEPGANG